MTKRDFVIKFVLNKANSGSSTDGPFWARHALEAWKVIEKECPEIHNDKPQPR